jgi:hypothetical protein
MGNGSGVLRGDRNRNARLERLRVLVPVTDAGPAGVRLAGCAADCAAAVPVAHVVAALWVITSRDRGDFARTRRLGLVLFEQAVRREIIRRGGQKPSLRILRGLFIALSDPAGVIAHRAVARRCRGDLGRDRRP